MEKRGRQGCQRPKGCRERQQARPFAGLATTLCPDDRATMPPTSRSAGAAHLGTTPSSTSHPPPRPRAAGPHPCRRACAPPLPAAPGRGLRLLELAGGILPQGAIVGTARSAWHAAWVAMVRELAPQSRAGAYERPAAAFTGTLGGPEFPVRGGWRSGFRQGGWGCVG